MFLHIHDKGALFEQLREALRPGGRMLFTDYGCGGRPWSEEFAAYVADRAYCLHTLPEYAAILEAAGFIDVESTDMTPRFAAILEGELSRIRAADIDDQSRAKLESGWRAKLQRVEAGDQRWGLLAARRPS